LFSPVKYEGKLLIDGGTTNPLPHGLLQGRYDLIVAIDVSGSRKQTDDNDVGLTDLLFKSFEIMQQSLIESQMQIYQPDIYIKTSTSDVRLLEFHKIENILEQAKPAQKRLRKQLLEFKQRSEVSPVFYYIFRNDSNLN